MKKYFEYLSPKLTAILGILVVLFTGSVNKTSSVLTHSGFKTKNVVIIVVDGPRYAETWGDSAHKYIPNVAGKLAKEGIVFTKFYNDGFTYTSSGHAALCTGFKQELENRKGSQLPMYPSFFQYYLKDHPEDSARAWIITTKDKLGILANCEDSLWNSKYQPKSDCGINGLGSGYREDEVTFQKVITTLKTIKPKLLLVNFKEPDHSGHAGHWENYLKGIQRTDSMVYQIWKLLQSDPVYKNQTAFFVTNDHGRHTDGWKDGFISHGDSCDGCRHINLFAAGPDFTKNKRSETYQTQVDLTATVATLLGLKMPYVQGKPIQDCFKNK